MRPPLRCNSLGTMALLNAQPAFQNDFVKGYATITSLVPEGFYFLLAVEINGNLRLHIGDQFENQCFLGAIYHPGDVNSLPTGLLCLDTIDFTNWLQPADGKDPILPSTQQFCFCDTENFIKNINTTDQKRLESFIEKSNLKGVLKSICVYFKNWNDDRTDEYKSVCLGIKPPPAPVNVENTSKRELTEAEKDALNPDGKKSSRIAAKPYVSYAPTSKVPIGAISLNHAGKTVRNSVGADVGNANKKAKVNNDDVIDLRTPQQKSADTKKANKLIEEARINDAVQKQLSIQLAQQKKNEQQIRQQQQPPQPQPSLHQQPIIPTVVQQPIIQQAAPTSDSHRNEMKLDFQMYETFVSSFEGYSDRRMEKFMTNAK